MPGPSAASLVETDRALLAVYQWLIAIARESKPANDETPPSCRSDGADGSSFYGRECFPGE